MTVKTTTKKVKKISLLDFHAKYKAKSQWKKRSWDAKAVYDMIVVLGLDLFEWEYFHPKMELPSAHFVTIIHNIGWLVADEITKEQKKYNKENPTNPVTTKVLPKKKK